MTTTPEPPDKQPDIRDKAIDGLERFYASRVQVDWSNPSEVGRAIMRTHSLVKTLIVLVIINLVATLYVADFVHQIEQAIHQL